MLAGSFHANQDQSRRYRLSRWPPKAGTGTRSLPRPADEPRLLDPLRALGIPTHRARTSAIRHLVLQAPAPVIAKALGYHDKTATRLVTEAGGNWSRYAPGDHERRW